MCQREITMIPTWLERRHRQLEGLMQPRQNPTTRASPTLRLQPLSARPGPSRISHQPLARAVHGPSSPRRHSISSDGSDDLPSPRSFRSLGPVQQRVVRTLPRQPDQTCGLEDRSWSVDRIVDRRGIAGEREYLVRWHNSHLDRRHIHTEPDGSKHVRCQGRDWSIASATDLSVNAEECSASFVEVVWEDSWASEADLGNAQEAVAAFDLEHGAGIRHVVQEKQTADSSPAQLDDIFRPDAGIDYGPSIRATMHARPRQSYNIRRFLEAAPLRPVRFRDEFINDAKIVNVKRDSKANATLAHSSGPEQTVPCERCELGNGPFQECVASRNNVGCCTNCQFDEAGPQCNFHTHRMKSSLRSLPLEWH